MSIRTAARFLIVILLAGAGAGCGKVGDPLPPAVRVPQAAADFSVEQVAYDLHFRWTNPLRNLDQSASTDLERAVIRGGGETVAAVAVGAAGQPQFHVLSVRDVVGTERTYSVHFETTEGRVSSPSNEVSFAVVEVPGTGVAPRAVVDQGRVRLDWSPPSEGAALVGGYRVYRSGESLTPAPVDETSFEDAAFQSGAPYSYQVVAVRRVGDRVVEGIPYARVDVAATDRSAPAAPTGLRISPYPGGGVFVQWQPGPETDIARYRVYRRANPEVPLALATGEQTVAFFTDPVYRPGFQYAVAAVDEAGNESPLSEILSGP